MWVGDAGQSEQRKGPVARNGRFWSLFVGILPLLICSTSPFGRGKTDLLAIPAQQSSDLSQAAESLLIEVLFILTVEG